MSVESCDKHDGCVVCYESAGYRATCPVCTMSEKLEEAEGKVEKLTDELEEAREAAEA